MKSTPWLLVAVFPVMLLSISPPASVAQVTLGADMAVIGEPEGPPISGEELTRRTEDLTDRMRCPVCQGLSIADSDTMIALAMKEEVRQFLAAGYTEEQVLLYFEASYGEFIRLEPKPTGINLVVWIAPGMALLIGLGVVVFTIRSRRGASGRQADKTSRQRQGADPESLDAYRERVRREVGT